MSEYMQRQNKKYVKKKEFQMEPCQAGLFVVCTVTAVAVVIIVLVSAVTVVLCLPWPVADISKDHICAARTFLFLLLRLLPAVSFRGGLRHVHQVSAHDALRCRRGHNVW
jgi:hypothetical protein